MTISQSICFYSVEEFDALCEGDSREAMPGQTSSADFAQVASVLEPVRRLLRRDGGDLELVEIAGTVVHVRLLGNCVGCPHADFSLKNLVERAVMKRFPQVTEVVNSD